MSRFGLQEMELKDELGKEKFHPLIDFSNPNRYVMKLTTNYLMNVMFHGSHGIIWLILWEEKDAIEDLVDNGLKNYMFKM